MAKYKITFYDSKGNVLTAKVKEFKSSYLANSHGSYLSSRLYGRAHAVEVSLCSSKAKSNSKLPYYGYDHEKELAKFRAEIDRIKSSMSKSKKRRS